MSDCVISITEYMHVILIRKFPTSVCMIKFSRISKFWFYISLNIRMNCIRFILMIIYWWKSLFYMMNLLNSAILPTNQYRLEFKSNQRLLNLNWSEITSLESLCSNLSNPIVRLQDYLCQTIRWPYWKFLSGQGFSYIFGFRRPMSYPFIVCTTVTISRSTQQVVHNMIVGS